MATSRHISYCQPHQDTMTQDESSSKAEFDDGSETLAELEKVVDKVTLIGRWINREAETLNRYIQNYQRTKKRFEEDIEQCKLQLLSLLRKQEEKTREMKKLNLLIFETAEGLKRTDEQSKIRAENLCLLATNRSITVQWATQLENSLPGMYITRVRFFTEEDKKMVLAGEANLFKMGIYVDHDLTKSELKKQRDLNEMAEEARAKGKATFVGQDTVCIDGTYHTLV